MDRADCLVGHTGFVGGALLRQTTFAARFNSGTISDIANREFGTVVCAAAPGSMLEANSAPERDRAQIDSLIRHLSSIEAERFVLISSIAVLADFAGGEDEATQAFQDTLAYGRHRRLLEAFVEDRFQQSLIVRLPALFGQGLRKNFIFDLMNPMPSMLTRERLGDLLGVLDRSLGLWVTSLYRPAAVAGMLRLERPTLDRDPRRQALEEAVNAAGFAATQFHHRDTTYQYYDTDRLWADIGTAMKAGLPAIHLVSEPLAVSVIHQHLTGRAMPETGARLHREDMRTRHAALWGASGPYQFDAATTLARLAAFVAGERAPA